MLLAQLSMPGEKQLRRMSSEEFVRRLRLASDQDDTHYVFWIGAGCSISSGIPGAASLVTDRWLPKLRKVRGAMDTELTEWARSVFPGYEPTKAAAQYGEVMEELFLQPEARQREIEALCDGRYPAFGYAVLAALLGRPDGLFNVALTTNFDDLIADAMYVFTEARPLVIPDEALAAYIRPTRMRPLVVKVHGDHRLSPRNTQTETSELKEGISESIRNLLHDRGLIFVGYGGQDNGIAELMNALPRQALPLGIWWASPAEPKGVMRPWLEARDAIWVETSGFDELMLLFRDEFDLPQPNSKKFDRLFAGYVQTLQVLSKRVDRLPDTAPEAPPLKDAAARVDEAATDWSSVFLQASRYVDSAPDEAESLYRQGIEKFPDAPLLAFGYGELLINEGRFQEALPIVEAARSGDPENFFLEELRARLLALLKRTDEAKDSLRRMAELQPSNVMPHAQLGILLAMEDQRDAAERELSRAMELQPTTAAEVAVVALLLDELGKHEFATEFHQRAIAELPEDGNLRANYARCLIALGRDSAARSEIQQALKFLSARRYPTLLEAYYYKFVVGQGGDRNDALRQIKKIIELGYRSPNWDLTTVAEYGENANHDDRAWLRPLATVIVEGTSPRALDGWKKWNEIVAG